MAATTWPALRSEAGSSGVSTDMGRHYRVRPRRSHRGRPSAYRVCNAAAGGDARAYAMAQSHRWIEHTSELQLELHALSEVGVFAQAIHALRELLCGDQEPAGERVERTVEAEATDRPALLAEWLAELVFLAETEGLVPVTVRDLVVGEDTVSGVIGGRRGDPPHLVKAVTYHDLELRRDRQGWRGNVVLDV
jgi:SHS2 domain-containing protein